MSKTSAIICFLLIIHIFIPGDLFAHKEQVHQYLAIQGFELLKKRFPQLANSPIATHMGAQSPMSDGCGVLGDGYVQPWTTGMITVGAFAEDCEDVVYNHDDVRMRMNSHFWDADQGDDFGGTFCIPTCSSYPNAFQKVRRYVLPGTFGHWDVVKIYQFETTGWPCGPPTDYMGVIVQYDNLIEFYKTGAAYQVGYVGIDAENYSCSSPQPIVIGQPLRDQIVWEVLGRVIHLLGDMAVPSHVHNDSHCQICGEADLYETWEESHYSDTWTQPSSLNPVGWNADYAFSTQGGFLDVYNAVPSHDYERILRYLFYTTNQIADRFPSNDENGDNTYSTSYNGNDGKGTDDYSVLNIIQQINHSYASGSITPSEINNYAFLFAMRSIAGLYYWFATETGMISKVVVQNDFVGGHVMVGGTNYDSPAQFSYYWGDNTFIDAENQPFGSYDRVFNYWEKFVDGIQKSTSTGSHWDITVHENATYVAHFRKQYNVTLSAASYLESGNGGTYNVTATNGTHYNGVSSWNGTFIQDGITPITVEAVPPSTDWFFLKWSDGTTINPYSFIPTDHKTLYAIFKKHLASSISSSTGPNNQRKIISVNGDQYAVYTSAGSIWYTKYHNGVWSPEVPASSSSSTTAKNPSIAISSSFVHIVWEEVGWGNHHEVFYKQLNESNGLWSNIIPLSTSSQYYSTTKDATPVVQTDSATPFVIWAVDDNQYTGGFAARYDPLSSTNYTSYLGSVNSGSKQPSISTKNDNLRWLLSYIDPSGSVQLSSVYFSPSNSPT
jgi:hypothetical protein